MAGSGRDIKRIKRPLAAKRPFPDGICGALSALPAFYTAHGACVKCVRSLDGSLEAVPAPLRATVGVPPDATESGESGKQGSSLIAVLIGNKGQVGPRIGDPVA